MSGPTCKTCKHFNQAFFAPAEQDAYGECSDRAKAIYDAYGSHGADFPVSVYSSWRCNNWEQRDERPK